ncbi:MAG: ATP-binding protein, partial [Myxococcota bacterium]
YSAPVRRSDGRTMMLAMVVDVSDRRRTERGRQLVANANAILTRSVAEDETLERFVAVPVPEFADLCVVDLLVEGGQLERIIGGDPGVDVPRRFRYPIGGEAAPVIATGRAVVHRDLDPSSYGALARDEGHLARILAFRPRSAMTVPMVIGDRILGALSFASRTRNFDEVDEQIAHDLARKASNATENRRLFHEARTARGEAEAANRAKDQFLAVLGHELRNPLAPIATALHLMAVRSPDQVVRERAVIERQVGHLRRLVDDLLDVSRITRGKVELRRERAPVAGFVARGIELASPLLEERRHRLTVDVAPELAVHGDPTRLGQVVANLVANAAKYTEPGGSIVVRATRQDDAVELAVKDDGIGIPAEMLPTIFELFVQAPQGSARTTGGLGLGLAIVRSLVEQHDGTVAAHSDGPGTGTELVVRLPAVGVALQDGPTPVDERRRTAATRRILVVDDNEDAAVLLAEALGGYGHEIRTAFDGPSALRIAGEFRPQIAVLDLGLPVMDGYELAQRLRASPEPPARLVAVTGYGEARDRARSRAAGFDAHLVKPVSLDDLLRGIAEPA